MTGETGLALALAAAGAAFVARSGQGSLPAAGAGFVIAATAILGLGPGALAPLAVFVLGAGALTRLGRERKEALGSAEENRGRRDSRHVAAKLGIPALLAIAGAATDGRDLLRLAYAASLAGAFADTAATEVGPLVRGRPFVVAGGRFRRAEHGAPGAMSVAGLLAAAAASALLSATAAMAGLVSVPGALAAAASGLAATIAESLVAGTGPGRELGHFGRNVLVSVGAAILGLAAGWKLGLN
ncbi:MAG TPA: DUF92 domain-containing protein [Candidatus Eisenbacteria bacterium]|nr:DUF92 domain-containing protein [Candidatus Eisenbacteria bacterium]